MSQHALQQEKRKQMDIAKLIANAEAQRAAAQARYDAAALEQRNLLDEATGDSLEDAAQSRFDELTTDKRSAAADLDTAQAKVTDLRKQQEDDERLERAATVTEPGAQRQAPGAKVGDEPHTYNRGNQNERRFFTDAFNAQRGDRGASERIERHRHEAEVDGFGLSERAGATSGFAGLVPPQYLTDLAAPLARAGRPTANVVQHFDLPPTGMSIIIPRGTTGVTTGVQATENAVVATQDQAWSNLTVPVVTIAGYNPISRQSLERGEGIDQLIYNDLRQAYNTNLDTQVLSGTGSGGQMLGILNTSGVGQAAAFTAAATAQTVYNRVAGMINSVETGRFLAPDVIIMHPRRWNWLLTQVDGQNRPLVVPNANGPFNSLGVAESPLDTNLAVPVGWMLGLPVITDPSIPTAVGTGPEDQIIVARKEDLLLWENGDGAPFELRFDQTAGTSLTVTIVAYNYAAFTAGRYPLATGIVGGNAGTVGFGLITPVFV